MTVLYTPNVKIYKGIDNELTFQFRNRDQKRTDISGKTIRFILINDSNIIFERTINHVDSARGTAEFIINKTDIFNLDSKYYRYSIKIISENGEESIGYADDNYGASGTIEIIDNAFQAFVKSFEETFTEGNTGSAIYLESNINRNNAIHTAQIYFDSSFTGTLQIQASLYPITQNLNDDDFVTVKTVEYENRIGNDYINWKGVYNAVRFVRSDEGLSKILYRP